MGKCLTRFKDSYKMNIINSSRFLGVDLADGLSAYYPFNANANDESGNGYDGIVTGATLTTDKDGNNNSAYSFSLETDNIAISDNDKVDFANESFSVSVWDNTFLNALISRVLLAKRNTSGYTMFLVNGTTFRFDITDGVNSASISVDNQVYVDTWVNRIVNVNRATGFMTYYINGVMQSQVDISAVGSLSNTGNLVIGNNSDSNRFYYGSIDNVRIYNKVLTEEEIAAINNRYV